MADPLGTLPFVGRPVPALPSEPITFAADASSAGVDVKIRALKWMTVLAMRLGNTNASARVLTWAHDFHVGRVDARRHAAKMIDHQSGGDWPNQFLVRESVSANLTAVIEREPAIPESNLHAKPSPAGTRFVDVPPESISVRFAGPVVKRAALVTGEESPSDWRTASAFARSLCRFHSSSVYHFSGG